MIVADTGAIIALIDRDDKHYAAMVALFESDPSAWVLLWAIFSELGLIGSVVAAIAERLRATVIATVDLRDFGALELVGHPKLFPRDS